MAENKDEEAEELLRLVIQQRRQEIQKETPKVNTADALRRTIMSLINEGVKVDHLKEPSKRKNERFLSINLLWLISVIENLFQNLVYFRNK